MASTTDGSIRRTGVDDGDTSVLAPAAGDGSRLLHPRSSSDGSWVLSFRDVYDDLVRLSDESMLFQDRISGLLDAHLAGVSNKLNQVMKVLTIISTIFIPLTFIVGVYGMNFSHVDPATGKVMPLNMPELYSPYGYAGVWLVMKLITVGLLIVFKKRGWLEKG